MCDLHGRQEYQLTVSTKSQLRLEQSRHEISIRRHSFFVKSHLHIPDIINFIITYAEGQSLWKCAQIAGVRYGSTAVDWGSFCRDLFVEYYVTNIQNTRKRRNGRRTKYTHPRGVAHLLRDSICWQNIASRYV